VSAKYDSGLGGIALRIYDAMVRGEATDPDAIHAILCRCFQLPLLKNPAYQEAQIQQAAESIWETIVEDIETWPEDSSPRILLNLFMVEKTTAENLSNQVRRLKSVPRSMLREVWDISTDSGEWNEYMIAFEEILYRYGYSVE